MPEKPRVEIKRKGNIGEIHIIFEEGQFPKWAGVPRPTEKLETLKEKTGTHDIMVWDNRLILLHFDKSEEELKQIADQVRKLIDKWYKK